MATSGIQGQVLELTVVGARNLKDTEWISRQDPYVIIEYASNRFRTKTDTDGGKNPSFNDKFMIPLIEGLREIHVQVWNSNVTFDDFIGSGKILIEKAISTGYDDNGWNLLSKTGKYAGEVRVILHFASAGKVQGEKVKHQHFQSPAGAYPSYSHPPGPYPSYAPPQQTYSGYATPPPPPPPPSAVAVAAAAGPVYPSPSSYPPPPVLYPAPQPGHIPPPVHVPLTYPSTSGHPATPYPAVSGTAYYATPPSAGYPPAYPGVGGPGSYGYYHVHKDKRKHHKHKGKWKKGKK